MILKKGNLDFMASPWFRSSALSRYAVGVILPFTFLVSARADLPQGFGQDTTIRVCGRCHSPERAASQHQTRQAWEDTVSKMVKLGAQGSDEEFDEILIYLSAHFGPEKPAPLNMNKATSVDLQTALLLLRSQAQAIIQYRQEKGEFHSFDDLRQVPGLDLAKLESKKSRIVF